MAYDSKQVNRRMAKLESIYKELLSFEDQVWNCRPLSDAERLCFGLLHDAFVGIGIGDFLDPEHALEALQPASKARKEVIDVTGRREIATDKRKRNGESPS